MRKPTVFQEYHFEVKPSSVPECGLGLFTTIALRKGDTVGPYLGQIISDAQSETEPYIDSHYLLWLCTDYLIVGENYTRYINHAAEPNVQFVVSTRWKKARVEVLNEIAPGSEIFLDYGPDFWEMADIACISSSPSE